MWFLIIFLIIFLINFEILFLNEELIICVSLLIFFYIFFYNLKSVLKKNFFYKIEYIYFIFKTLIDINVELLNYLLKCVNFYNNLINFIVLIELNIIKFIKLNFINSPFSLNFLLNKILINLLISNKFIIKNNTFIFDIEYIYKIKYLKIK